MPPVKQHVQVLQAAFILSAIKFTSHYFTTLIDT